MGLFDFFKKKKKKTQSDSSSEQTDSSEQTIQYEAKISSHELKAESGTVEKIVDRMVEEDPFKRFYNGKTLEDFNAFSKRIYKYEAVTTVNIDFDHKEKGRTMVVIEETPLGFLPEERSLTIQDYQKNYVLTSYVYVTGGPYREYDTEKEETVEASVPYGLDIYIQFS